MKYLRQMICMIFLTIVITILSNYKVNALTINGIDFPEFPGDNNDSYVLYYSSSSYNDGIPFGYNLVTFNKDNIKYVNFQVRSSVTRLGFYKDFCFDDCSLYDVKTDEEDYKVYNLNNSSWELKTKTSDKNQFKPSANTILSSNITIYVSDGTYDNSTLYKSDENVVSTRTKNINGNITEFTINPPTSLEDIKNHVVYSPIKSSSIRFEDNVVNDLDNRNVNLLKVDFNDIYNSNYKYQISFDNKNWIDVTDTIITNDNHYIIYSLMANTTIYAKVLSQDNEEIDMNNKTIDNLNDYQLIKSVSSTDTLNIYSIDFRLKNIQNTMGYEHYTTKIKLQYGSNDHTNKNRPYYLDYSITGLDNDGMDLDIDLTDYYNVQINNNEYYLGDYESFLYYDLVQIKPLLPNKVKQLKVSFYFSNLDNYYIHCYTTNTKSQTEIRFTESLFKDYVLYQFPSGFDYALIRPKSFQTSNGSLIADAYYFNSGVLEMPTFDFKNNDISTIFDTTMDKSNYLIEGNNVKFNFTSDEDNNVYPALYLRKEVFCNIEIGYNDVLYTFGTRRYFCVNEKKRIPSATFYVHKDFYVEFINKNTLETKVVNIDKGDFEDKNNLELTQDFKNKVNEKYPEEEASSLGDISNFINNLKESFLGKFKFIGQLKEIYDIFNINISEDTEPPNWTINVEFKPLGIKYENLKVIDFSFFEEYKELLFNFEKLFLSTFTIIGIVRNIKKGSD